MFPGSGTSPAELFPLSTSAVLAPKKTETEKPTCLIILVVQFEVKSKNAEFLIYILFSLVFSLYYAISLWISIFKSYFCWFFFSVSVESCTFWRKAKGSFKKRMNKPFFSLLNRDFFFYGYEVLSIFFVRYSFLSHILCYNNCMRNYYVYCPRRFAQQCFAAACYGRL